LTHSQLSRHHLSLTRQSLTLFVTQSQSLILSLCRLIHTPTLSQSQSLSLYCLGSRHLGSLLSHLLKGIRTISPTRCLKAIHTISPTRCLKAIHTISPITHPISLSLRLIESL
jgi:hypothetical protein